MELGIGILHSESISPHIYWCELNVDKIEDIFELGVRLKKRPQNRTISSSRKNLIAVVKKGRNNIFLLIFIEMSENH